MSRGVDLSTSFLFLAFYTDKKNLTDNDETVIKNDKIKKIIDKYINMLYNKHWQFYEWIRYM